MIPALSIRQPWAWLIVNGHKDIENRDWPTVFRGRMLIHAGLTMSRSYYDETVAYLYDEGILASNVEIPRFEVLERGGLVGWAEVVDCVTEHNSRWIQEGSYGFVLRNGRTTPFVPFMGRLGFFNVPKEAIAE